MDLLPLPYITWSFQQMYLLVYAVQLYMLAVWLTFSVVFNPRDIAICHTLKLMMQWSNFILSSTATVYTNLYR